VNSLPPRPSTPQEDAGIRPVTREAFERAFERGELVPLVAVLPYLDPCLAYERVRQPVSLVLESVRGPASLARFSIIVVEPYGVCRIKDGHVELRGVKMPAAPPALRPLSALRRLLRPGLRVRRPAFLPFAGGAAGLISYDFVRYLERLPAQTVDDLGIPDLHLLLTDTVVTVDHVERRTLVSVLPLVRRPREADGTPVGAGEAFEEAGERLRSLCEQLVRPGTSVRPATPRRRPISIEHENGEDEYRRIVRRAKQYIEAGDIFQANLSQRLRARIDGRDPWLLYRTLRAINPSPFAAYADFGDYVIASSSPERLVKVSPPWIETRPIAGTRPRGRDAEADRRMRAELLINEKERAEHIMLIDLERNDLGKISAYGSVHVDELMVTEDYSHVIHIVSNVRGRLVEGRDAADVLRAVFPGGTITGVPKVRCMEIIEELERFRRGPYTGSLGYFGFDGALDLNIIIRTFVIRGDWAYVQAGAGIVADSDPGREYRETLKKAEALIRTLERV